MKTATLAVGLLLSATAVTLAAQQSMPGMNMPPQPAVPKADPQQPSMPDMDMGQHGPTGSPAKPTKPNRNAKPPETMPKDIHSMGRDIGDRKAQGNAASEENSVKQQAGQTGKKPDDTSDRQSIEVPIQELQEPEAIDIRTGGDLPTPELLGEIVKRPPVTVEQFVAMADKANPTLAQAGRNVDRSREQARQVGLPPNPSVGYIGDQIRGGSYGGGEQGAFILQEFVLGHKLALRRNIYLAEGRANEYAREVQRARVHNDVARAFFDALAAQQSVAIHDRLLRIALDEATNTHELARIGQADAAAILTAEVGAEQAQVDFVTAQRTFLAAFAQLAALAGQTNMEPQPLQGALTAPPEVDAETEVATDMRDSPLVKQAQAARGIAEAQLKDAKREAVPNLTVQAGEWYSGEYLGAGTRAAGPESYVTASVQLPLWNRNQGNVRAAEALADRAQKEVARTTLWTRHEAEPFAQQYQTARFTAERYRTEMLPRARRAYQLQVTKYQQMSLEYPAVLTAQHMLFTLQLGYTEALHQEWQAAIALQNYALMNGLDAPVGVGSDATTINLPTAPGPNQ